MFLGKGVHDDGGFVVRDRDRRPQGGQHAYSQQNSQQFLHGFLPPFIYEERSDAHHSDPALLTLTLMLCAEGIPLSLFSAFEWHLMENLGRIIVNIIVNAHR
jgi:hypothetical protein